MKEIIVIKKFMSMDEECEYKKINIRRLI